MLSFARDQRGIAGIVEIILVTLVIGVLGFVGYRVYQKRQAAEPQRTPSTDVTATWQKGGLAITGKYADAEVVDLGNSSYRLYYSIEPEVTGNQLELYSATSTDGVQWKKEAGTRKTFATFADVVKLPGSKWRMYFQNAGVIKSATSNDGLKWTDEPGTRIDSANDLGLKIDNVAAPTTYRQGDGSYVMVYRGTINQRYQEQVPNSTTSIFLWATSQDGLEFTKQGMAIDSRNQTFAGMVDGPEWVQWSDGKLRLFFWGYQGIYYAEYTKGEFGKSLLTYTTATDNNEFPASPPGDPTLAKIKNTWYMYYGQHPDIEYATLTE